MWLWAKSKARTPKDALAIPRLDANPSMQCTPPAHMWPDARMHNMYWKSRTVFRFNLSLVGKVASHPSIAKPKLVVWLWQKRVHTSLAW